MSKSNQSFTAGFVECVKQVEQFLKYLPLTDSNNTHESDPISHKLLSHLENYYQLELSKNRNINTTNNRLNSERITENIENKNNTNHNIDPNNNDNRNLATPNSFSVIHHTSQYSADSPSTTRTISPIPTPEMIQSSVPSSPFSSELDMRSSNLGLYGNERNGSCYQVMDVDGVWRPW